MAETIHDCLHSHDVSLLEEDLDPLEPIAGDDDNMSCGSIVRVQVRYGDYHTELTDDGSDELRDMPMYARVSVVDLHGFPETFVDDPEIIARVKDLPPR
ncbi:hypothetical protein [Chachezhania sediminis]|uniref:hypothetical protein n=1 Tax=Chachezhania sediminis TaxID=2599291 RepID=UPI00131B74CD|nr:hypothetical protein [Chachezhania sediminis]